METDGSESFVFLVMGRITDETKGKLLNYWVFQNYNLSRELIKIQK